MVNRLLVALDLLLLAAAGALGVQLYRIWSTAPPAAAAPAKAGPATPAPVAATPQRGGASPAALGVIAERNLFSPTRSEVAAEPPKPAGGAPTAAVRPVEKPRLYGIVLGPDGGSRAYLWDPQTKKVFGYKVGDTVGDSRVEQIAPDRVVLRRSGESFDVLLHDPAKPRPTPTAPAAAPAPPGVFTPGAPGIPQFPGQVPGGPSQVGPQMPQAAGAGQPGPEGTPTPPLPGQPPGVAPGQRPGMPPFPIRPPIRVPPGLPGTPTSPAQPQASGEAGS